jgi:hypothetical protein
MDMIERVARAIANVDGFEWDGLNRQTTGSIAREEYRAEARAAIEAMMEPTDAMRLASKRYKRKVSVYSGPECYRQMIQAALEEK